MYKKLASIITILSSIYQAQHVQAMMQDADTSHNTTTISAHTSQNLTKTAEDQERTARPEVGYVSPQGLTYRTNGIGGPKVQHIKRHCDADLSKRNHTYFRPGTLPHNDIVLFIDSIF